MPSLVVPKQPPEPIEEMPPDVKPDGANVVWVTGYWAWDDTRKDYIWVSGIWRDTPPNHVWVAGYWNQVADGFQWTPGFWSPEQQEQVNYLPEPPQTVEQGPTIPQPSPNDFWVPGNWQYNETRYMWRPGYWTVAQPDWIWTPAHYVWTPSGYIFIPGHWDYMLERRPRAAYARFLDAFREDRTVWQALPREVSAWWRRRAASHLERSGQGWKIVGPAAEDGRIVDR